MPADRDASGASVTFAEALRFWFKLGFISFGGPAGQIAIMQTELVDRHRWIDQRSFLRGLSFCTLLPGPEAQQLAAYIGWRLHGLRGAIAAGTLFVIPGAVVLLALSWLAAAHQNAAPVAAIFYGLKPVVIAIILHAAWRIGKRTLKSWQAWALAAFALLAIAVAEIDFPWIVAAAGLVGWWVGRAGSHVFTAGGHGGDDAEGGGAPQPGPPAFAHIGRLVVVFLVLWAVPVALVLLWLGRDPFIDIANLFTKAAFVTFGGAYAVLPYIAEEAVETYRWLTPAEMINGLALAETTPGPLILVLQYVGFFAGWHNSASIDPALAAVVGAALTTYVTFLPCFLFILAGAPYIEGLHGHPAVSSALGAITAAVVGVIVNLGVFLARAVFLPAAGAIDWFAIVVAIAALATMLRWTIAIHWYVLAGAAIGLAHMAMAANSQLIAGVELGLKVVPIEAIEPRRRAVKSRLCDSRVLVIL